MFIHAMFASNMKRSLSEVIDHLSRSPRVKALFTTGTTATGLGPSSDIDLVVILDTNEDGIKSAYTMIGSRFADIFFFDVDFVNRVAQLKSVPANGFEGIFVTWLAKGKIEKDERGLLAEVKKQSEVTAKRFDISFEEKQGIWFKANYNFIANQRYFRSEEELYHKALEIRLLYSVTELIVAYFTLRDLPWRGEKEAMGYFERDDTGMLQLFMDYVRSPSLTQRFDLYEKLFKAVMYGDFQAWDTNFLIVKDQKDLINKNMTKYVQAFLGKEDE